jgi:hypothetical protein
MRHAERQSGAVPDEEDGDEMHHVPTNYWWLSHQNHKLNDVGEVEPPPLPTVAPTRVPTVHSPSPPLPPLLKALSCLVVTPDSELAFSLSTTLHFPRWGPSLSGTRIGTCACTCTRRSRSSWKSARTSRATRTRSYSTSASSAASPSRPSTSSGRSHHPLYNTLSICHSFLSLHLSLISLSPSVTHFSLSSPSSTLSADVSALCAADP